MGDESRIDRDRIDLMVCCRNRNGRFLGRFDHLSVSGPDGDVFLDLHGPPTTINYEPCMNIGLVYGIGVKSHGQHVGNIFWDSFVVTRRDARRVLEYLLKRRRFDVESGESEAFEAWKRGEVRLPY